jgi:hypothetical protein
LLIFAIEYEEEPNMALRLPLQANQIRKDGPHERLGNSFGKVRNNFQKWHKGWDLSAAPNTPIYAISAGEIVQTFPNVSGYGKCLILEFDNPKYNPTLRMSVGGGEFSKALRTVRALESVECKGQSIDGTIHRFDWSERQCGGRVAAFAF